MADERQPGVYVIVDMEGRKCYLGSSVDLPDRLREHQNMLVGGYHHNPHLQRAFNQRGGQMKVIPLPINDGTNVLEVEQALLDEFCPTGVLYNIATDASMPMLGRKHTAETRQKLTELRTGKTPSEETRQKLSETAKARGMPRSVIEAGVAARVGKSLTPEHVEKVRQASVERMQDPERRALSGTAMLGKKHSPETIAKMKEACKGRKPSLQAMAARDAYNQQRQGNLTSTGA